MRGVNPVFIRQNLVLTESWLNTAPEQVLTWLNTKPKPVFTQLVEHWLNVKRQTLHGQPGAQQA